MTRERRGSACDTAGTGIGAEAVIGIWIGVEIGTEVPRRLVFNVVVPPTLYTEILRCRSG